MMGNASKIDNIYPIRYNGANWGFRPSSVSRREWAAPGLIGRAFDPEPLLNKERSGSQSRRS